MMKYLTNAVGMLSVCILGACESAPKSSLMPDDVPVLYEEPKSAGLVSTLVCDELRNEFDMLTIGLGEEASETPIEERRSINERLQKRARSLIKSELNRQLGGAMDVIDFLTDKKETDRLRAEGKKRGLIRRAYVMGYMDASACGRGKKPNIEFLVAGAKTQAEEQPIEHMEALLLADTFIVESEPERDAIAVEAVDVIDIDTASFTFAVDYVLADQETIEAVRLRAAHLPAPDDVGEDGLWPPKDALVYLEGQRLKESRRKRLPSPDDVDEDGMWPPKDSIVYLDGQRLKESRRRRLPSPDDVDEDGMWPPKGTLSYEP